MTRSLVKAAFLSALAVAWAVPAAAQQSTLNLNLGYFAVKGEDSRATGDAIVEQLDVLLFDMKDFNNVTFGGEYLVGLGNNIEAGVGAGYYQRSVPTIYADLTRPNGAEIEQELKLRIVPVTATVRWLPLGQSNPVQPYFGAGIGAFKWRYTETGDFVDLDDIIFHDTFEAEGTDIGPVLLAGIRGVSGAFAIGGEFRYQHAEGTVGLESGFFGDKIDLGGYTLQVTLGARF